MVHGGDKQHESGGADIFQSVAFFTPQQFSFSHVGKTTVLKKSHRMLLTHSLNVPVITHIRLNEVPLNGSVVFFRGPLALCQFFLNKLVDLKAV